MMRGKCVGVWKGSHGGCKMSVKEEEEYERFFYCIHFAIRHLRCIKKNKIYFCLRDSFRALKQPEGGKERGLVGRKQGRDRS